MPAMPNQETLCNVADRVATITVNRPDKLNAWTAIREREVPSAIEDAERNDSVRNRIDGRVSGIVRRRERVASQHAVTGR